MPGLPTGNRQLQQAGLESLGSEKALFQEVGGALFEIAESIINKSVDNLERKGNVATGNLISKMKVENYQESNGVVSVDIVMPEYAEYLDKGVNGTEVGYGSEYSYTNKMPPVSEIRKWIVKRGRKARADKYKPTSATDKKNKRLRKAVSENDTNSLAFAIARSIYKRGLKPTKFLSKAIKDTQKEFRDKIGKAFRTGIIKTFK